MAPEPRPFSQSLFPKHFSRNGLLYTEKRELLGLVGTTA